MEPEPFYGRSIGQIALDEIAEQKSHEVAVAERVSKWQAAARIGEKVERDWAKYIAARRNAAGIGLLHYYFGVGLGEVSSRAITCYHGHRIGINEGRLH